MHMHIHIHMHAHTNIIRENQKENENDQTYFIKTTLLPNPNKGNQNKVLNKINYTYIKQFPS